MYKYLGFILIFSLTFFNGNAQSKFAIGGLGEYNFGTKSKGIGLRVLNQLSDKINIFEQIIYTPEIPVNSIEEIYFTLGVQYKIIDFNQNISKRNLDFSKPVVYTFLSADYNYWINFQPTIRANAKQNNLLPMLGLGATAGKNWARWFVEGKYNILWLEPKVDIGFMIYPGFLKNKKRGANLSCPVLK